MSLVSEGINSLTTVDECFMNTFQMQESDGLNTFRPKSSLEGPGGTPDNAEAELSMLSLSQMLTEELQQIIGFADPQHDENNVISLDDLDLEEK